MFDKRVDLPQLTIYCTNPMNDPGGMKVFDAAEHLVEKVGHAFVVQVHLDHLAEVGVHQLHDQVDILEFLQGFLRRERIQ